MNRLRASVISILGAACILLGTVPTASGQAASGQALRRTDSPAGAGTAPDLGGAPQLTQQPSTQPTPDQSSPSIQSSLGPLGDPGGVRASLAQHGITYSLTSITEVLGDPVGGARRGAIGEGYLNLQADVDLGTFMAWTGAKLHANALKIYGDGLTRGYLFDLSTASSIEAQPSTRLYEAWFEQTVMDGELSLRLGQLGADSDFIISQYATLFVNSTYGWPNFGAYDLPSGGPAYPLATPGIRLKYAPDARWTLLAAVFDGNPAGARSSTVDPQKLDRNGTDFRVTDPPLVIAEADYTYGDKDGKLLPGTAKFGAFDSFGSFAATIPTAAGLTLGSGAGRLRGNDGIYGVVDQQVYRVPGTDDGTVGVFARLSGEPGDRNLISFYADGGVTGKGLVTGRPDDTAGLSFAFTQISPAARRTDREERAEVGPAYPIRSHEVLFEATYQAQVVPGFTLQPDVQYIVRPGGGIPSPLRSDIHIIRDAAVFGLRATVQY